MRKIRALGCAAVSAAMVIATAPTASAGPTVRCGDTITSDVVLTKNLTCSGDGLQVTADGVTVDLNGYRLRGRGERRRHRRPRAAGDRRGRTDRGVPRRRRRAGRPGARARASRSRRTPTVSACADPGGDRGLRLPRATGPGLAVANQHERHRVVLPGQRHRHRMLRRPAARWSAAGSSTTSTASTPIACGVTLEGASVTGGEVGLSLETSRVRDGRPRQHVHGHRHRGAGVRWRWQVSGSSPTTSSRATEPAGW